MANKQAAKEYDKIILPAIPATGHHGAFDGEKDEAQPYEVYLEIYTDIAPAAATDDLALAIDYSLIYRKVQRFIAENSFDLLETLTCRMADMLLQEKGITGIRLRVCKCSASIDGESFPAAVEILRFRDEQGKL